MGELPVTTANETHTQSGSERRQRSSLLGVRMTPQELARVRARADQQGSSVSDFVRNLVLPAD